MAALGSISRILGTRSTPLESGIRTSRRTQAIFWRWRTSMASAPLPAVVTSKFCWDRNRLRALRIGSSSSTTRMAIGPFGALLNW